MKIGRGRGLKKVEWIWEIVCRFVFFVFGVLVFCSVFIIFKWMFVFFVWIIVVVIYLVFLGRFYLGDFCIRF